MTRAEKRMIRAELEKAKHILSPVISEMSKPEQFKNQRELEKVKYIINTLLLQIGPMDDVEVRVPSKNCKKNKNSDSKARFQAK